MDKRRINGHWYAIGVPDRCPVCNIKKRNVLLHIHSKDSCKEKIDKQVIENWKKIEQKNKTKKYKQKYIESGGNKKAVRKYQEKLKAQKDEIKRKEKIFGVIDIYSSPTSAKNLSYAINFVINYKIRKKVVKVTLLMNQR